MALKWLQKGPKMQNFPGRCPWTPLGGSERPPDPQFIRRPPAAFGHRAVVFAAKVRIFEKSIY